MTNAILSTVIVGAVGLLIAGDLIGSIASSITNANLTGSAGLLWGLVVGLFGVAVLIAILKEAGIDI